MKNPTTEAVVLPHSLAFLWQLDSWQLDSSVNLINC